jgi:hypothetical protein
MSSNNTGCVYNSQLSLGLALNVPSGNNLVLSFDNNYDIMLYNINSGSITFYTKANQIIIPSPSYYVLAILNPEQTIASTTNETYLPSNPPSQQLYGFVITVSSSNAGQNSNGTYTIDANGVDIYFNSSIQTTLYIGYGQETPVLSNTLFSLSNLIQQLEGYYPLQNATAMNEVANENPICGTLIGSPDPIVFVPTSSGTSTTTQQHPLPFVFGTTFYPKVPPLPPAPPSKSNRDLITLGVVGALAVAGAVVSRKAK